MNFLKKLGNTIQSDIICGNNFGNLGLIVHGKYITVKEDAHSKLINVIKITEIYEEVHIKFFDCEKLNIF